MSFLLFEERAMPKFEMLTESGLKTLVGAACVLEQDHRGPKVYQLSDGRILKLFRVKRLFSSATLRPYSLRFMRNALALARLGIPTLKVEAAYRLTDWRLTAVLYDPLPGMTLRQLAGNGLLGEELIGQLGAFVADLHRQGVYFRSLHFGNIVLAPSGAMGLIDIADLRVRRKPLPHALCLRNLRHLCRLTEDRAQLGREGWQQFCENYLKHGGKREYWSVHALKKMHQLVN